MHNLVIDLARARQWRPLELELRDSHHGKDPRSGDLASAAELRPTVLAALDTLTVHQRAIVVLRYFEDLSQDEVAELLGVSPGTVKSTASIAVARLTAVQVLDQLSVAAGRAPQPPGRYITLTENDQGQGYVRTTVFDGLTGDVWTYQHGSDVPSTTPVAQHWSPTRAEFATWPTNPKKLRALLLSQGEQAGADDEEGVQSATLPGATPDDLVFQEATSWLWNPPLSPPLRSAVYKVLAATPGVTVKTGATDAIGQPAIEISRHDSDQQYKTYESPSTGAVLEQDFGDVPGAAVYTAVTGYASPPTNPYNGGGPR